MDYLNIFHFLGTKAKANTLNVEKAILKFKIVHIITGLYAQPPSFS